MANRNIIISGAQNIPAGGLEGTGLDPNGSYIEETSGLWFRAIAPIGCYVQHTGTCWRLYSSFMITIEESEPVPAEVMPWEATWSSGVSIVRANVNILDIQARTKFEGAVKINS